MLAAMACRRRLNTWIMVTLCLSFCSSALGIKSRAVPCYFIFGASSVDNGNNNALVTLIKSNFPPYGIDFRDGQTGRFTNGKTSADITAQFLGFDDFIPSFANARSKDVEYSLGGLNYASGGSGIRDETGRRLFGDVISFNRQLVNHRITVARIATRLGGTEAAKQYLSKCLYSIHFGDNDFNANYFSPQDPTSSYYTAPQYAAVLAQQLLLQLRTLYHYGARKVAVFGLTPIGCQPSNLARFGTNGSACVERLNDAVQLLNKRLVPLVDKLNMELPNSKFIHINQFGILSENFASAGVRVTEASCCKVGTILCQPNQEPCSNRSEYKYWDAVHLTETVNTIIATRAFTSSSPNDAYPTNIGRLVSQL